MDWSSFLPLLPEIVFTLMGLLVMTLELLIRRKETIAILTIVSIGVTAYFIPQSLGRAFNGMFVSDTFSVFFKYIFFLNLLLTVLISLKYLRIERSEFGEYYSLLIFSTLGMMIMASAGDLIVLYLGLELMALSTYVLAGFVRHSVRSNEAALKYFLLGAFSSGIVLFGISLIYALTGTTLIQELPHRLTQAEPVASVVALVFLVASFGFKVALVPFHVWTPDVYEGAPTSVTSFMSVGPKAAGFAALARVFIVGLTPLAAHWQWILAILAVATMAVGNILAIQQVNIKRMLAYSSIAHAGYAVLGLVAFSPNGLSSMLNYLLIYAFMNIGAFSVVIMMRSEGVTGESLEEYKGLARRYPFVSALMLLFMFSLTGIPPTAGFIGKFFIFKALVERGLVWLAVVAVIFSVISAYFYLRVVMYMYMYEPEMEIEGLSLSPALGLAVLIAAIGVIVIGVYPEPVLTVAANAGLYLP